MARNVGTIISRTDSRFWGVLRPLDWGLLSLLGRSGMAPFLADRIAVEVLEIDRRGRPGPLKPADGRVSILALTPGRFRSDLEALAALPDMRVLRMPFKWQARFFDGFYGKDIKNPAVHQPAPGSRPARARARYRQFLAQLLPALYQRLDVDMVIGANVKYREDVDWGAVSNQLGIPYVVFHRENLPLIPVVLEKFLKRWRQCGQFQGTCIAVHNRAAARTFFDTDYASAESVLELGCIRMDRFLERISLPREKPERPLVTLFSFKSYNKTLFPGTGYFPLFRDTHGAMAALAQRRPDVDVVIKPKADVLRDLRWHTELRDAFKHWGVDPDNRPPNLRVDAKPDAQDLILRSSVVVALNSTTQLEAAVAGLPVVMPNFRALRESPFAANVRFREHSDLFDVPDTGEDLIELVQARLQDPSVSPEIMERRRALFAELVSPVEGNAVGRYAELVRRIVGEQQTNGDHRCGEAAT